MGHLYHGYVSHNQMVASDIIGEAVPKDDQQPISGQSHL